MASETADWRSDYHKQYLQYEEEPDTEDANDTGSEEPESEENP